MSERRKYRGRGDGREGLRLGEAISPPPAEARPALPAPGTATAVASGAAGAPRPVLPLDRSDDRDRRADDNGAGSDNDNDNGNGRRDDSPPQPGHDEEIPRDLKKPGTFAVIVVLAAVLLLLGVLFAVGVLPRLARNKRLNADAREAGEAPTVNLTKPRRAQALTDLVLPGNVMAWQDTGIYARITGYVKDYSHDLGDAVKQGDLLAVIEAPDIDQQLQQARAQLGQSRAGLQRAQADVTLQDLTLHRFEELFRIKAVNEQQLNQQQAAAATAHSNLDQINATIAHDEANVRQFEQQQEWERVTAPFDGRITARNVDKGQLIMPGTTATNSGGGREMFHMAATDVVRVMVSVPQTFVQWVQPGQPADVFFRDDPKRAIAGKVTRFAGAMDPTSRTLLTEVDVPNPGPGGAIAPLTAGMYLQVKLSVRRNVPPLMVPESAMIFNAEDTQLAVVRQEQGRSIVHFLKIGVGRDTGAEIEAANGLGPDDLVVVNPGERLVEGGPVKVGEVKTPPPPSDDARKGPGELGTPGATPVTMPTSQAPTTESPTTQAPTTQASTPRPPQGVVDIPSMVLSPGNPSPPVVLPATQPALSPTPPADGPGAR